MPSYLQVEADEIPIGKSALLLFIAHGDLCGGLIEHRADGQMDRRIPDNPSPDDVVPMICRLMSGQAVETLYIVIEDAAYWPEPFPALTIARAA